MSHLHQVEIGEPCSFDFATTEFTTLVCVLKGQNYAIVRISCGSGTFRIVPRVETICTNRAEGCGPPERANIMTTTKVAIHASH